MCEARWDGAWRRLGDEAEGWGGGGGRVVLGEGKRCQGRCRQGSIERESAERERGVM